MLRGRGLPSHGGDGRTDGRRPCVSPSYLLVEREREGEGSTERNLSPPLLSGDCARIIVQLLIDRWIYGLYMYFIQGFLGFVIDGFMGCICILYRDF